MLRYLYTFEETEERITALRGFYEDDVITGLEYADGYYGAIDDIEHYDTIPHLEIERLLDCVYDLPIEVCDFLKPMLLRRAASAYEPITGVGIRMPEDEQRQRIPHTRSITEGLLERLSRDPRMG